MSLNLAGLGIFESDLERAWRQAGSQKHLIDDALRTIAEHDRQREELLKAATGHSLLDAEAELGRLSNSVLSLSDPVAIANPAADQIRKAYAKSHDVVGLGGVDDLVCSLTEKYQDLFMPIDAQLQSLGFGPAGEVPEAVRRQFDEYASLPDRIRRELSLVGCVETGLSLLDPPDWMLPDRPELSIAGLSGLDGIATEMTRLGGLGPLSEELLGDWRRLGSLAEDSVIRFRQFEDMGFDTNLIAFSRTTYPKVLDATLSAPAPRETEPAAESVNDNAAVADEEVDDLETLGSEDVSAEFHMCFVGFERSLREFVDLRMTVHYGKEWLTSWESRKSELRRLRNRFERNGRRRESRLDHFQFKNLTDLVLHDNFWPAVFESEFHDHEALEYLLELVREGRNVTAHSGYPIRPQLLMLKLMALLLKVVSKNSE